MTLRRIAGVGAGLALALGLLGCAGQPDASPTPTVSPTADDEPRFLVTCVDAEGAELGIFTRLEEAWASPNYVRIEDCEASAAAGVELTADEAAIAEVATDVDGDAVARYLRVLETCVRVTAETAETLEAAPTSLLEAALELCPDAPHAGLMDAELQTRGAE